MGIWYNGTLLLTSWISVVCLLQLRAILYDSGYMRYLEHQIQRRKVEWWQGGGENGELLFNGHKVSVLQDEKSSEIGRTMWMYLPLLNCTLKRLSPSPGWCGSVDWVWACKPKGCQFDSQSGYMSVLQARSPVGGVQEATTHWCFFPSLSPYRPLSLQINKIFLKIPFKKGLRW